MEQGKDNSLENALRALENLRMRLLDLTARNRLINFKHTKAGSLRIIDELPNQLVEELLSETEMRFEAVPEPTKAELINAGFIKFDEKSQQLERLKSDPSAEEWAKHLKISTSYEVPESTGNQLSSKHTDAAIQTLLYPYEMEARLKSLLQASESAMQEMGANILYAAFGFLEWYESNSSDSAHIAPLFLVPVRLAKGRLNPKTRTYEYTLSYSGEDIIPNLSLREKLRADFALALPDLDENTVPEDYFKAVQDLITDNHPRWCLRRFISLTLLNFSKLLMYLDLDPKRWPESNSIAEHPVVKQFLSGYGSASEVEGAAGFTTEYKIDDLDDIHNKYPLIDDADSSQHSALIDAINGKNLVIEGPPGTGKSQTITNLIAAAMSQGKKVLFVAEKLAALEVVRSRLDKAGLGEFCLELHSHKSQKRKILDEVDERLKKNGRYRQPHDIEVDIARYEELKNSLKNYAEKINSKWKRTGKTHHEIFMAATRYRNLLGVAPEKFHPSNFDGTNYDVSTQRRNEDHIEAYRKVYKAIEEQLGDGIELQDHPWFGINNINLQTFDVPQVLSLLDVWQKTLITLRLEKDSLALTLGFSPSELMHGISEIVSFARDLNSIPSLCGNELLEKLPILQGDTLKAAERYLEIFEDTQGLYKVLSTIVSPEHLQNLSGVVQLLEGSQKLKKLVGQQITLGDLADTIRRLSAVELQIQQVKEPILEVVNVLGETSEQYFVLSQLGLAEFKVLLLLVASLNPTLWDLRSSHFDNDQLDSLLPSLRSDVERIREMANKLEHIYALDKVPSEECIQQLYGTLIAGGPFRWFKSDWRTARKKLLSYVVAPQVKFPEAYGVILDLAVYAGKRDALERNTKYKVALGDHLQGISTDLHAIESIRYWYKRVRSHYGVGFGAKAKLGDLVINLSPVVARGIRSLVEQNLDHQIQEILDELSSFTKVFEPVEQLKNNTTLLVGKYGIVPFLLQELSDGIQACGTLNSNNKMTMVEMAGQIDMLCQLKHKVDTLNSLDFDNTIFQGALGLKIGAGVENSKGIAAFRNTLVLAICMDRQLSEHSLTNHIYQYPTPETFEALSKHASLISHALGMQSDAMEKFISKVDLNLNMWARGQNDVLEEVIARGDHAFNNEHQLHSWLNYIRSREQLQMLGVKNLISAVESKSIHIDQVEDTYKAAVYDLLSRDILKEDPQLDLFSGQSQDAIRDKFRDYDNKLKWLQCKKIAWQIDKTKIPNGNIAARVSERTEKALLDHECGKKTRHIPIRQLVHRAGNALVAIKPCFMMSPMSVAQYLAPGKLNFDLVIMDEASQIKPQDALGAIARGSQIVVVGDPKQLPPTSFFDRAIESEEDDPTALEESESILDATLPMFSARRLRWHYRSQHESLIAFSNHYFYDQDLILFPSPHSQSPDLGVAYSRVKHGCFINRKNMEEALAISEAVREHLKHRPSESLGVVTMSAEQRLQIERAIETLAKDDPVFQSCLDADSSRHESLFIKNLENVQGDERDVILISMTYGPQEPGGNVFQRFGPINSDIGWRRLNVLFTRSKKRMHIFSSMGADDIVVDSSSKRGVKALKDFLNYCEKGLIHSTNVGNRPPDSDFEIAVMSALRAEGFECVPQVGVAGFFIDVAVVDPGNPGRYLMGIECDGATYHSAKSARDRDRLRQAILERLGWNIRRIWSTDWFKNPQGQLKPIIAELLQLKSERPLIETQNEVILTIGVETSESQCEVVSHCYTGLSLREKLIKFDKEIIRIALPSTPDNARLLRPAMLEALIEYLPTSKSEFLELVPPYIRQATDSIEGKYLDRIFDLINGSFMST